MSEILKANIFFFVTTVVVVVLGVFLAFALYYVILILRNVRKISDQALVGSTALSEDLAELRQKLKAKGARLSTFFDFAKKWKRWFPGKRSKQKKGAEH